MNKTKLDKAIQECNRFLIKCLELKQSENFNLSNNDNIYGCKESGAVNRSSMDLTRSLAELRSHN